MLLASMFPKLNGIYLFFLAVLLLLLGREEIFADKVGSKIKYDEEDATAGAETDHLGNIALPERRETLLLGDRCQARKSPGVLGGGTSDGLL